nr:BspA family leucine-rich repeat surface protein [Mycoplasma capricolum]
MKKLLTILGSTSLLVLPTFSVLSCTNSYWTKAEEYTPDSLKGQEIQYLQKAMYKNDECVQIGFFESTDGKIQIVPFKPTTTKVPSTLPSQITSLKEAFKGLKTASVDGIQNWDTKNITDMTSVFDTTDQFNQNISNWNTSEVTNMSFMFTRAKKFNQDLNS